MVSEWQDISTAPRDGTKLLIWERGRIFAAWWEDEYVWAKGWIDDYNRSDTYTFEPSHWMPLPSPPEGA